MRSRSGFLLLELVTAVFIIGVILVVTTTIIFACSDHVHSAHSFLVARQIASNQLELLHGLDFDDLHPTSADGREFTSPLGAQLRGFVGEVRIEPFDGNPALKRITVTVRWNEQQRARGISFSVLRAKRTR
jgi:type II secretory pathway pseudopilin PulG